MKHSLRPTSNAWPSSKSNVTIQKHVTHLLKRSHGKIGPSYSLRRNISSQSHSAIFLEEPSVFSPADIRFSDVISGKTAAESSRRLPGNKHFLVLTCCSNMASCSDGQKSRQISYSDELLHLPIKHGKSTEPKYIICIIYVA